MIAQNVRHPVSLEQRRRPPHKACRLGAGFMLLLNEVWEGVVV